MTTSTTGADAIRVRAGSPAELLAVIPHLLGFVPESSFVVIGIGPDALVRVSMRYDLPSPDSDRDAAGLAAHAVAVLRSQDLTSAVAAGYGPDRLIRPVAQALLTAAAEDGIDVPDVLRQDEDRYWSYTCTDLTCCPPCGTPVSTLADPVAITALAGISPALASRAALAATLTPLGGSTRESMREATGRAEQYVSQIITTHSREGSRRKARAKIVREGLVAVAEMIGSYRAGGSFRTDYQLAWLSVVLRDLRIRDDAWARMDPGSCTAHQRLWTDLTRRAEPGYVAAPASLLAFCAWQAGNGALAHLALDRAQADDRAYSMAALLRDVLNAGAPPSLARLPLTPEQVADEYAARDDISGGQPGAQPDDHGPVPADSTT